MFGWMLRSQMPVRFDGACTSALGSAGRLGGVVVGVVAEVPGPVVTGPADPQAAAAAADPRSGEPQVALTDLLVEEVSIDGMCGVY